MAKKILISVFSTANNVNIQTTGQIARGKVSHLSQQKKSNEKWKGEKTETFIRAHPCKSILIPINYYLSFKLCTPVLIGFATAGVTFKSKKNGSVAALSFGVAALDINLTASTAAVGLAVSAIKGLASSWSAGLPLPMGDVLFSGGIPEEITLGLIERGKDVDDKKFSIMLHYFLRGVAQWN